MNFTNPFDPIDLDSSSNTEACSNSNLSFCQFPDATSANTSVCSWRQIQRTNFTKIEHLCDFLGLNEEQRQQLLHRPRFSLNLPRRLAEKMPKGTLDDPLIRQFLPLAQEAELDPLSLVDPVDDRRFQRSARLLQKYEGRALLITTGACAMHCRYCFRQNYDYNADNSTSNFEKELSIIEADSSIHEVILSGGDPLSLSNERLLTLLHKLDNISHLRRLRIHTRFPIGIPERLDAQFLDGCSKLRSPLWIVLHTNHPRELDKDVLQALSQWRRHGAILLNQTVLLKGVNDDIETLQSLCTLLINHGITPYYLHKLDRVQGAAHFDVPANEGLRLTNELRARLPGYGVPLFVQEIPGERSKTPL